MVIPAYNAEETIGACIHALRNQTIPPEEIEIIVVNDASIDNTVEAARSAGADVLIDRGKLGKSGTRNAGASIAKADIVLFTDSDCEPQSDWVEEMLKPFETDPAVVGVKGAYLSRQSEVVARFTQLEVEERYDRMAQQPQINFIDTYAAGYRRDVFLANGGFDTSLPEVEDQDLSYRLAAKGYRMVFAPHARVYHRHATEASHYFRRKFAIGKWRAMLMHRHPERIVTDSRTPPTLKLQMGLVLLLTPLLPLALLWRPARKYALVVLGAFLATCAHFLQQALARDKDIALLSLPLLFIRAAALAWGYVTGLFSLSEMAAEQEPVLAGKHRLAKTVLDSTLGVGLFVLSAPAIWLESRRLRAAGQRPWESVVLVGQNGKSFNMRQLNTHSDLLRLLSRLVNVFSGHMNLVGPVPLTVEQATRLRDTERLRLAVRPGIIGPVQLQRGELAALPDRLSPGEVALELDYLRQYRPGRDIELLRQGWRLGKQRTS